MRRIILISIAVLVFLIFSPQAFGGTAIVINSATVDGSSFDLFGINFTAFGTLEILIGDICLTCSDPSKCEVGATLIECDFAGTPAASGGTWTVSISAGNAPHVNEEIDVFIPTGLTAACNTGDFVECYTGDPATKGVGLCQSGIRTCDSGEWSDCTGQVLPEDESCDDQDNDCDGDVDEGAVAVCDPGLTACDCECVDLDTNFYNCGGCYAACPLGEVCTSGICVAPPTCSDGIQNQDETDIDCGGPECGPCADGESCLVNADCISGFCGLDGCASL